MPTAFSSPKPPQARPAPSPKYTSVLPGRDRTMVWFKDPWWRHWEDIEENRKKEYDPMQHVCDRIYEATLDFQDWPRPPFECRGPAGLDCLWDQFRIYIGLSYRPIRSCAENAEEDSDDEAPTEPASTLSLQRRGPRAPRSQKTYRVSPGIGASYDYADDRVAEQGMTPQEQHTRHIEEKLANLFRFVDDVEYAMKHLFSAYFLHYNLIITKEARKNMPVLAYFFLRHLQRSNVFDKDDRPKLERAITVVGCARRELANIGAVGAASNHFARECSKYWPSGTLSPTPHVPFLSAEEVDFLDVLEGSQVEIVKKTALDGAQVGEPSAPPADDWNIPLVIPELATTHKRGVLEASVRRVVDVHVPVKNRTNTPAVSGSERVEVTLTQKLCAVTLEPVPDWRSWNAPLWPEVEPARMLSDGRDTLGETITLLTDSDEIARCFDGKRAEGFGTVLSRCRGMFIAAKWAELVPNDAAQGRFFYMDQYLGMMPSFYTPDKAELSSDPSAAPPPSLSDAMSALV